jgi:hypothetical protein
LLADTQAQVVEAEAQEGLWFAVLMLAVVAVQADILVVAVEADQKG